MKHEDVKMDKSMIKKAVGKHAAMPASKAHKGLMAGGKVGYADGGMPMTMKGGKKVPSFAADGVGKMKSGGMATKMGSVKTGSKPDGLSKVKTKGTMVKMARGGKAC